MAQYLRRAYGDAVDTRYLDMAEAKNREAYPDFAQAADVNRWSLPLVAIDGKIWFTGYVDHRSIVQVIEKKRAALQGEE